MKYFISFCLLCATLISVLVISKGWQLITDGFRLDKIKEELIFQSEDFANPAEKAKVLSILDQNFFYLDKGCQAYVFESEDGNYVIKFARYHKYRLPFWLNNLDFCKKGAEYKQRRKAFRTKSRNNSMLSYQISYQNLVEQTGTIYTHVHRTNFFNKKLTIIDRLKRKYLVDLDSAGFVIQKKAKNLRKQLLECKKNDDFVQAKNIVDSFLVTISSMCKKGIVNRDYNCVKNSGILDGKVVIIDLGSFFYREDLDDPELFEEEMRKFTKHFRKFAIKEYEQILEYFEDRLTQIVKNPKNEL